MDSTRAHIGRALVPAIADACATAERSIVAMVYTATVPNARSPLPMEAMHRTMCAAPRRKLNCRLLIATFPDASPQQAENLAYADALRACGWAVRTASALPIWHPKCWLFDRSRLFIGSHNSTVAGLNMTRNISVEISGGRAVADVVAYFEAEWARGTDHG